MDDKLFTDVQVTPETSVMNSFSSSSSPSGGISGDELSDSSSSVVPQSTINAENYITVTEGCQTILTVDELTECVNRCKELVLDSEECSEDRKWLVRRLVELRHRLQQALESEQEKQPQDLECVLQGHHFKLKYEPASTSKKFCDRCCGTIWHLVQSWYQCIDCQYKCHIACLAKTLRVCAHLIMSENPLFETKICPEIGLSAQGYRCHECHNYISIALPKGTYSISNPFSLVSALVEARRCDYNGKYYCPSCHWGSTSVIPSRAVNNWDFEPRPVSRSSLQMIRLARPRPIITLQPRLYDLISELPLIKMKREELGLMKQYISTCRLAIESGFLMRELEWRRHLVHSTDCYSLDDLIDINNGKLMAKIDDMYSTLIKHITVDCKVCQGRGYICEHCDDAKIIFPFDITSYICPKCSYVQHKACWVRKQTCPKCIRNEKKKNEDVG